MEYQVNANDCDFGVIEAMNEQEARDKAAQMAGYKSEADMIHRLESASEITAQPQPLLANRTIIQFWSGDLSNGNINPFASYDAALADYKEMAEGCASPDPENEDTEDAKREALEYSLAFHYVTKVTTTYDEDGKEIKEESETLDGGDPDACGYHG